MLRRLIAALTGKRPPKSNDADFYPIVGKSRRDQVRAVSDEWPVEDLSDWAMVGSGSFPETGSLRDRPRAERWRPEERERAPRLSTMPNASGGWAPEEPLEETMLAPSPSVLRASPSSSGAPLGRPVDAYARHVSRSTEATETDDEATVFVAAAAGKRRLETPRPSDDDEATRLPDRRGRDRHSTF